MYIAVKGGEQAIAAARALRADARRGDRSLPELADAQVQGQLGLLVARVMAEASLYDPALAALAIRQAAGDILEAVFLLRAYRNTLPRLLASEALDLAGMRVARRVSSIVKDLPGGQLLGPTADYSQRLIDFELQDPGRELPLPALADPGQAQQALPGALQALVDAGLVEPDRAAPGDPEPPDITREPPVYPLPRSGWLQMLARADEGWLLGLGYSTQRGYANSHPFAGELRLGRVVVQVLPDELGWPIEIGEIEVTECQMLNQFVGSAGVAPQFTRGYGLVFGHNERKAMSMALVDRSLRHAEFDEAASAPAQWQEFVLPHGDGIEASGFVQHLKLPHYVTFEAELQLLRQLREAAAGPGGATP